MKIEKGDVVVLPFPFVNSHVFKMRPAVVVSSRDYERAMNSVIVTMVTSTAYDTVYDYKIKDWQEANLNMVSWLRIKLITFDIKSVRAKIGRLSMRDLAETENKIQLALGI
ncbi:MAG: type II toxin-antitoxin system PemK/MazF family toxin [Nitrospirae bacterium]|nr:type II toxin-antitoxin system PemK/MazF family toxin [Nitrospirota bacterium]MBF0590958.1 type II toxin-antitoxin system PemK/MazF family toxin [Nitrospirota bacterium]